ncbi:MAG TPA: dihydropteroate synthase [Candidatus Marinimicrobia bacterium]|jgi:dihydropteroate synthase|nr:dihydropteroate synthase [Candidatus Neomarinimicrobiota bacterium]HHZ98905.1 dihydropteroate synthase [Candidatus Neomarinimicrobiota bacterium]HIB02725.1 dihydropteroate synthase [Candidatus Neomarinimicrobiota bacterium]HIB72219.1 dihydropteroate synthase [Candidatus Neomarinimicrobiota bacterium]HIB95207.1 dihydropteroate synthase [Candidatus Neomarinimicrobiota bacterium]
MDQLMHKERTLLMGVLNVTPDSFSDGGEYFRIDAAVDRALQMAKEGAQIIDIGGESSRPGAEPVSEEEELNRVLPVVEALVSEVNIPISIDTYKSIVARSCLEAGASIVNDISALRFDDAITELVAEYNAYVVLMHMKGTPRNMQNSPDYGDVMGEIEAFFEERITAAESGGIARESIILDPGIGFGKTPFHNFTILSQLERFSSLGLPLLVGPSRKSFIGMTLDLPENERLEGTAASVTAAVLNGAKIVRVHDVKEMKRVITIADSISVVGSEA